MKKTVKKTKAGGKKSTIFISILILFLLASFCGSGKDDKDNAGHDPTDILSASIETAPVMNGSRTEEIGTRAYINISKDDLMKASAEEFAKFAATKVDSSGYNWFSVIFDDGTGICFPGSFAYFCEYGKLDEEGALLETIGHITIANGTCTYEPVTPSEDPPEPETKTQPTAPATTIMYTSEEVNVRSGPGSDYSKLATFPINTPVSVYDNSSEWAEIDYNGEVAYLYSSYLSDTSVIAPTSAAQSSSPEEAPEQAPAEVPEVPEQAPVEEPDAPASDEGGGSDDRTNSGGGNSGNSNSSGNGNNFNTYDNEEQQNTTDTYVLNTSTKKIHYRSCRDVPKIAEQNYATSSESIEELEAQGYSTCGHCFR